MSTPLHQSFSHYSENFIQNKQQYEGPLEALDDTLIKTAVELAKKKNFKGVLEVLTSVKNFEKMAQGFREIREYIENQEQLDKVIQAAKNTLNQGSRDKMTWGEMKMLPKLLEETLEFLNTYGKTAV